MTNAIYNLSKSITEYRLLDVPDAAVDLSRLGERRVGDLVVEVIDPVQDYTALMKEIFDFDALRKFIKDHPSLKFLFDAMHGGTARGKGAARTQRVRGVGVTQSRTHCWRRRCGQ